MFLRPMPVKTPTSAPFWDALADHRVVIQYSPSSQSYVFYPRVRAPRTLADDLEWREISGMGTVYAFTVARRPVGPHFADAVPQLLAIVEWDGGPRFSTESDAELDLIPLKYVAADEAGMRCEGNRCSALVGEIRSKTSCAIYAVRPHVCRTCSPGDFECLSAREFFGIGN